MGLLDKTKSPVNTSLLPSGSVPSNSASSAKVTTTTTNLKISGNKKASYSFYNENNNSEVSSNIL
jgi:hypothetical protein